MKSQLYLWNPLRQKYINDLSLIKNMFIERIQPIFSNAEQEATNFKNELWESIMQQLANSDDETIDPADYVDFVEEQSFEHYEMLSLMRYRNISMWICCLCQVWEQQLYSFVLHEAISEGINYDDSDLKRGFIFSKEIFEWHQQPFENLISWPKIKELRLLVNVIKHAEGDSEKKLRKLRPDYFHQQIGSTDYDLMEMYHTTLLEATLFIQESDFIDYFNSLVQFWNELPERMYTEN